MCSLNPNVIFQEILLKIEIANLHPIYFAKRLVQTNSVTSLTGPIKEDNK